MLDGCYGAYGGRFEAIQWDGVFSEDVVRTEEPVVGSAIARMRLCGRTHALCNRLRFLSDFSSAPIPLVFKVYGAAGSPISNFWGI